MHPSLVCSLVSEADCSVLAGKKEDPLIQTLVLTLYTETNENLSGVFARIYTYNTLLRS